MKKKLSISEAVKSYFEKSYRGEVDFTLGDTSECPWPWTSMQSAVRAIKVLNDCFEEYRYYDASAAKKSYVAVYEWIADHYSTEIYTHLLYNYRMKIKEMI